MSVESFRIIVENAIGGESEQLEFEIDVWHSDTVSAVKEAVCENLMMNPSDTMLVYNGKPLDDDMTMAHLGLGPNSRLQLIISFPGGNGR